MTRGITNSTLVSKLASRRFNIVNLVDFAVGSNNYVTDECKLTQIKNDLLQII